MILRRISSKDSFYQKKPTRYVDLILNWKWLYLLPVIERTLLNRYWAGYFIGDGRLVMKCRSIPRIINETFFERTWNLSGFRRREFAVRRRPWSISHHINHLKALLLLSNVSRQKTTFSSVFRIQRKRLVRFVSVSTSGTTVLHKME